MNRILALCGAFFMAALPLNATSVRAVDHTCPACQRKVRLMVLMSYSRFDDQPRNLSSMLGGVTSPQICPYDLFADYAARWEKPAAGVRQRIKPILKKRTIVLTAAEHAALKKHGPGFFEPVRRILWYRTCLPYLDTDEKNAARRDLDIRLRLYYGSYCGQLKKFYRSRLITHLAGLPEAGWLTDDVEKLVYAYLHAELLREAGRDQEAATAFLKVIADYKKLPGKTKKNRWITDWAQEQLTRTRFANQPPEALRKHVNTAWLTTDRWEKDRHPGRSVPEAWMRHRLALTVLTGQLEAGNPGAGKVLADILDHKVPRLLALQDTTRVGYRTLNKYKPLKAWLAGLRKQAAPDSILPRDDKVTRKSIRARKLGRLLGKSWSGRDEWLITEELLPHFENWRAARAGTAPLPQGWSWQQGTGAYKFLIDEEFKNDPARRKDAMLAFLQLLPQVPDQPEKWSWSLVHGLQTLAKDRPFFQGKLTGLLTRKWQSKFWKDCAAYLNGSDNTAAILSSPLMNVATGHKKRYRDFCYGFFGNAKDSCMKASALKRLSGDQWIDTEVYGYLADLLEPSMIPALEKRIQCLRSRMNKKEREKHENEMYGYELGSPEDILRQYRMKSLTFGQ